MPKTKKETGIPSLLRKYMDLDNIAPELDDQILTNIASEVIEDATKDEESRYQWKKQYDEAMKNAKQISNGKHTPWQGAADVKYPLILSACIQYNARMYPEIVQGTKVVNIVDMDPEIDEIAEDRNDRIGNHMSWQLLEQVENWKSDTDKLLMVLPLAGVVYRKTRFDSIDKKPAIDLCLPADIIVHNDIASLERAERITHILHLSDNEILEKMRAGIYTEYPLDELQSGKEEDNTIETSAYAKEGAQDSELHEIYEQHTFYDLDDDGYAEPYIITVHRNSSVVLRIVARFTKDSFVFANRTGRFIKIKPDQYFTDYHFMPSPDGTFHSMGFGKYLYPINETVNTIINQLLDAGTLQNRGGGFIAKSLRMSKEELRFKIGEFKTVNVPTGTVLSQNIFPMPAPGPSPVLMQLLPLLIKSAEELASVSDVMQGQAPGANTPATTVMSVIEQGSKVYSAMLNRLYQSFKKEYEKLFKLNQRYLDVEELFVTDQQASRVTLDDYRNANIKVFPVADPSISSDAHRMAKMQALMQLMQDPDIDKHEVVKRYLDALKIPHPEKVLPDPDPNAPPPVEELKVEADMQLTKMQTADILMKRELEALSLGIRQEEMQIDAAYKGGQVTSSKIDSVARLAQTDAIVGEKAVGVAERQAGLMQTQIQPAGAPQTAEELAQIQASLGQQLGIGQQQPQPQGPGQPPGAGPGQPEGQPGQQIPPEIQQQLEQMRGLQGQGAPGAAEQAPPPEGQPEQPPTEGEAQ